MMKYKILKLTEEPRDKRGFEGFKPGELDYSKGCHSAR
jgi:hypothetical protein